MNTDKSNVNAKTDKEIARELAKNEKEAAKEKVKAEKEAEKALKAATKEAERAEKNAAKEAEKKQKELEKQKKDEEKAIARAEKDAERKEKIAAVQQKAAEREAERQASILAAMEVGRLQRQKFKEEQLLDSISGAICDCENRDESIGRDFISEREESNFIMIVREKLKSEGKLNEGIVCEGDDELTIKAKEKERIGIAITCALEKPEVIAPSGRVLLRSNRGRYLSNEGLSVLKHTTGACRGDSETFILRDTGLGKRELRTIYNDKVASFSPSGKEIQLIHHGNAYSPIELIPSYSLNGFWVIKCIKTREFVRLGTGNSVEMTDMRSGASEFEIIFDSKQ